MAALTDSISQLKYYLNNFIYFIYQRKAHFFLKKEGKVGSLKGVSNNVLTAADIQVFNAFEPIMNSRDISREDYLNNPETKREYREGFVKLISNFTKQKDAYSKIYPGIYLASGEINVLELSKLVRSISTEWVELEKNIAEGKCDKDFAEKSPNFNLGSYILTKPSDRKKILQMSSDKNYNRDTEIYKAFAAEINGIYNISFDDFMADSEKRHHYYDEYLKFKTGLSNSDNKDLKDLSDKDCLANLKRASQVWTEMLKKVDLTAPGTAKNYATQFPLAKFALMPKEQQTNLNATLVNNLNNQSNSQDTTTAIKK